MLLRGDRLGDVWRIEFSFNEPYCSFEVAPFPLQFLLGHRRSPGAKLRLEDLPCALIDALTRLARGVRAALQDPSQRRAIVCHRRSFYHELLDPCVPRPLCSLTVPWSRRGALIIDPSSRPGR